MEYYFKTARMSVGYHGRPLICDMEIGIQKGEILTLIGPNGAGKSTVLKSIANQLALLGGVAYLDGQAIASMPRGELAKKMAVVFTEKMSTELMTCEEAVATGRYPYTGRLGILTGEDMRAVREAMELVHVTDIKDRDFTKISDGQRQRVMLARAICQEPEIVILDEPTSFLDVRYKLEFLSVLQKLKRKKGLTVILSLHELELAQRISDHILCVKGKYTQRFGRPEEIFQPGYIQELFEIDTGSYNEQNGSMELEPPEGEAEVFVIAGGGTGQNVYRRLQREGRSFATGILFENDLDYPSAVSLAKEVVAVTAFEPIPESALEEAMKIMAQCREVVCCRNEFGSLEKANEQLMHYAMRRQ